MGFISWIRNFLNGRVATDKEIGAFQAAATEVCVRELAFQSAVNIMANSLSKCEFRTYQDGKLTRGPEWYLWNVRPNRNQSSSQFFNKLLYKLYRDNKALVIEVHDELYVADSFETEEFAFKEWKFSQVEVNDYKVNKTFSMKDVLFFELHHKGINDVLTQLYNSYGKLLSCGMSAYKRGRGVRSLLKISTQARRAPDFEKVYEQLTGTDLKKFMTSDYAVLPQYEGFDYDELGSKTYSAENSRDIKAMVDDIFDFTGQAFCIPAPVLKGEIADTEKAVDNLLTFGVDPLVETLQVEINHKRNGQEGYLKGNRLEVCTQFIRHIDLLKSAPNVEKLVSAGVFSVNEMLKLLGLETIDEAWADMHFITKNYAAAAALAAEQKEVT